VLLAAPIALRSEVGEMRFFLLVLLAGPTALRIDLFFIKKVEVLPGIVCFAEFPKFELLIKRKIFPLGLSAAFHSADFPYALS
jgi:hypothetical protein